MGTDYDNDPSLGYIGISGEPCNPTNILWTDEPWRGRVLYTGRPLNMVLMQKNANPMI